MILLSVCVPLMTFELIVWFQANVIEVEEQQDN